MILHLNRSQRAAMLRALDFRIARINSRRASGSLKENDELDEILLDAIRHEVIAGERKGSRRRSASHR